MNSRRSGGIFAATLCCLLGRPALTPANGQEWRPARVWVVGSDVSGWVVGASEAAGPSLPVIKMWYGDKQSEPSALKQSFQPPAVVGDPQYVAADVGGLRILFSDLTACDYFGSRPYSPGTSWRDQCRGRPVAWVGDSSQPVLYAVARTEELTVTLTTQSAEGENDESTDRMVRPDTELTVLLLRGGVWKRLPAPRQCDDADGVWIAGHEGTPSVFYRRRGQVFISTRDQEAWTEPTMIPVEQKVDTAWAVVTGERKALLVGQRVDDERLSLHLYLHQDGAWAGVGGVREGNELAVVDPARQGVGLFRGHVAVARVTATGGIELGLAPLGPAPALRFTNLTIQSQESLTRPPWEEGLTLALLLGILTMSMWSRRETAVRPIALPPGLVFTPIWKRAAAAVVDVLPAILLTAPWWYPKSVTFMLENGPLLTPEQMALLDMQLRPEKYATILVYGLWGFFWEAATGRTPGKMLLGCRVFSIVTPRPTARQCLIRNLVRSFMVSLGPSGLLVTLMTMVIVSRNRQRVGDLLAYTLVVEPGEPSQPPRSSRDEEEPREFDE